MKGLALAKAYYDKYGVPMLREQFPEVAGLIAAGLCGSGSECFGYDDEVSTDHDYEPGFCLFLPGEDIIDRKTAFQLERAYAKLPKEFEGYRKSPVSPAGGQRHGIIRTEDFFLRCTGTPDGNLSAQQWLTVPEQALAEAVNGEIFRDDSGFFTGVREKLSRFPEDIRLKKLAGCLLAMGQAGQYNFRRCLAHGENAAAQLALFEFSEHAAHCAFLLDCRYMPYYKWRFRALREFTLGSEIADMLEYLITTPNDTETVENKDWVISDTISSLLAEVINQGLSDAVCMETEKHAQSVNDRVTDPVLRNMDLLAAI